MANRRKWTASEERRLMELINAGSSLNSCFVAFSAESGRSVASIGNHYYHSMKSQTFDNTPEESTSNRKWTPEEDAILSRYVDSHVTNLKACFMAVAEQTGRTPTAVSAHWYSVLSKKEMHFATISKSHIAKNRKNGEGVQSNLSIWQRFVALLNGLHL